MRSFISSMKKGYLYLFVLLFIFTFTKAQNRFDFGVRLNQAVMQKLTSDADKRVFFATDYTAFLQFGAVGVFAGVTALNNYNTVPLPVGQHIECLTGGLFLRLTQLSKKGSLYLYLYDVYFNSPIYGQTLDVITINPRYHYNLLKNLFSVEAGLTIGLTRDYYSLRIPDTYLRPTIGANISVGLNVLALFAKN
jgi:hypothetical protein